MAVHPRSNGRETPMCTQTHSVPELLQRDDQRPLRLPRVPPPQQALMRVPWRSAAHAPEEVGRVEAAAVEGKAGEEGEALVILLLLLLLLRRFQGQWRRRRWLLEGVERGGGALQPPIRVHHRHGHATAGATFRDGEAVVVGWQGPFALRNRIRLLLLLLGWWCCSVRGGRNLDLILLAKYINSFTFGLLPSDAAADGRLGMPPPPPPPAEAHGRMCCPPLPLAPLWEEPTLPASKSSSLEGATARICVDHIGEFDRYVPCCGTREMQHTRQQSKVDRINTPADEGRGR